MKKFISSKWFSYIHQNKVIKEKLYPISFKYVWITFEHHVLDMCASEKKSIFQLTLAGHKGISAPRATNEQVQ